MATTEKQPETSPAVTAATPLASFKAQLEANIDELAAALPDRAVLDRFKRATMTAVQREPKLLDVDRRSLFLALTQCANDGFTPDGREAAIVPFKDKNKGRVAVYLPMTQGIVGRLRASGAVTTIRAVLVTDREIEQGRFEVIEGTDPGIRHEPIFTGDRGKVALVYAVAELPGGGVEFDWMDLDQLAAVERISRASDGPWKGAFRGEMMKKTVIRRLAKRLHLPIEVRAIVEADDERLYDLDLAAEPPKTAQGGGLQAILARAEGKTPRIESASPGAPESRPEPPSLPAEDVEHDDGPMIASKELHALIQAIEAAGDDEMGAREAIEEAKEAGELSEIEWTIAWGVFDAKFPQETPANGDSVHVPG